MSAHRRRHTIGGEKKPTFIAGGAHRRGVGKPTFVAGGSASRKRQRSVALPQQAKRGRRESSTTPKGSDGSGDSDGSHTEKEVEVVRAISKGNRFHVDPGSFTKVQLDRHVARLTFVPKQRSKSRFVKKQEGHKAYKLTRDLFSVPAEYGFKEWGAASVDETTLGLPMREGVKFSLNLWSTKYFPQKQARRAVWQHFEERRGQGTAAGVLALPCATGKTYTAAGIVVPMGRRTAVVVHQTELMDQMVEAFTMGTTGGLKVGIVHLSTCEVEDEYDVVVMMIPTLLAMLRRMTPDEVMTKIRADTYGFLLGDEAHHMVAKSFMKVLYLFSARYCLWLTATPHRDDGLTKELMFLTGDVIFAGPERLGMIRGVAVRYQVRREIPTRAGEVDFMQLVSEIASDTHRNAWAAHVISQMVDDGRTIAVFTLRAEQQIPGLLKMVHALLVAKEAEREASHWRHKMAMGDTEFTGPLIATCMSKCAKETMADMNAMPGVLAFINGRGKRDVQMRNKFQLKLARVIIVYLAKFSEGVNIPWLDTLMYLGAFKGENSTVQSANRATRPMSGNPTGHGKQSAFFIDVSDDIVAPVKAGVMLNIQRERMRILKRKLKCRVATMDVRAGSTPGPDFFKQCLKAVPEVDVAAKRRKKEAIPEETSDLDI